jgi:hypothetical protein
MDMKILELIEKGKIYIYMINIFLLVPIIILTHQIYVYKYGVYIIDRVDATSIINSLYHSNTWYAILTFTFIFLVTGIIESIIFPFITLVKSKKPQTKKDKDFRAFLNYLSKYLFGISFYQIKTEINIDKRQFFSDCYKIPTAFLLYSFCLIKSPFVMSLILLFSIYLFLTIYKVLITYSR